ncbi:MAG: hypothetical protein J6W96_05540 [Alphaproteobacteria bacterium]|nr:hypothetical protein [Alphaproteobacteria bacterium]
MQKIFFITMLLCLCACATIQKYEQKLNSYIGQDKQQLIASWGQPYQIRQLANGEQILTYVSINKQVLPDPNYDFGTNFLTEDEMFYPFTYGGNAIPDGNFMGETITDYCQTKFHIKNNYVTSWQYKGNACVAL